MKHEAILLIALAFLGMQRILELLYAKHTADGLRAQGARAVRPDGYLGIVTVHIMFFVGCAVEGWFAPWPAFGPWTYVGGAAFLTGEGLRYWSMYELGPRWNTRVYVLDSPLVVRGPYRLLKHPIYLGVTLELAGFALAFGLWATLVAATMLSLLALRRRIKVEEAALSGRAAGGGTPPTS